MEFIYRLATLSDLVTLVETRIRVLRAANGLPDTADLAEVVGLSRTYYTQSLGGGSHTAYLVYRGDKVVGAGGVSFFKVLPTCHNPSGEKAYIMNMYTDPAYRRMGIGRAVLDLLVGACKARGVGFITLEATGMGRPLYEKYGFVKMDDEMILPAGPPET